MTYAYLRSANSWREITIGEKCTTTFDDGLLPSAGAMTITAGVNMALRLSKNARDIFTTPEMPPVRKSKNASLY